jgi:hypothetical protein
VNLPVTSTMSWSRATIASYAVAGKPSSTKTRAQSYSTIPMIRISEAPSGDGKIRGAISTNSTRLGKMVMQCN